MNVYGFVTSARHCGQELRSCPTCGKQTFHTLERRKEWLTLFFLPVLPLGRGQGLARCNLCGQEAAEGGNRAVMSHVQAGTKTCPDCAELVKLEARLCRYCRYRFSEEEIAAAKQFAEARVAESAAQITRQLLLRRAGVYSMFSWVLIPPGSLWSILVAVLCIQQVAKQDEDQTHVVAWVMIWVIMSVPFFLGLLFRRKARRIRKRLEDPPAEKEEDVWGQSFDWG